MELKKVCSVHLLIPVIGGSTCHDFVQQPDLLQCECKEERKESSKEEKKEGNKGKKEGMKNKEARKEASKLEGSKQAGRKERK